MRTRSDLRLYVVASSAAAVVVPDPNMAILTRQMAQLQQESESQQRALQSRVKALEIELAQKEAENQNMLQICDELVAKLEGGGQT